MEESKQLPSEFHGDFYQKLRVRVKSWVEKKGKNYKFAKYVLLAPDLVHLLCRLIIDKRISVQSRSILAVAVAYFISPIDFVPEGLIGPEGYVDDVVVAVFALNKIINTENEDVVREHWAGEDDILKVIKTILERADELVGSGAWEKIKNMFNQNDKEN